MHELIHLFLQNYDEYIVTMTGLLGIGKTTLAMATANHLAYVYCDGCLWANMRRPVHRTRCGESVRSKSEVVIADLLLK